LDSASSSLVGWKQSRIRATFELSRHQDRPDEKISGYDNDVGQDPTLAPDSVGLSVTGCSQPVQ
jgi:hypothetical protein